MRPGEDALPGPQITIGMGRTMGYLQMIHPSYAKKMSNYHLCHFYKIFYPLGYSLSLLRTISENNLMKGSPQRLHWTVLKDR